MKRIIGRNARISWVLDYQDVAVYTKNRDIIATITSTTPREKSCQSENNAV